MMLINVIIGIALVASCKPKRSYESSYDGSSLLEADFGSMQIIPSITNTKTAGAYAKDNGFQFAPNSDGGAFNFFGLAQSKGGISEGAQVFISSSYGASSSAENALLEGVAARCSSMRGIASQIQWPSKDELCMRAKCFGSNTNSEGSIVGLEAPGTESGTVCDSSRGQDTLFSLDQFKRDAAAFALGQQTSAVSVATEDFRGDKVYGGKVTGRRGKPNFTVGGKSITDNRDALAINYSTSSGNSLTESNLAGSAADIVATQEGSFFLEFKEGGSNVDSVEPTSNQTKPNDNSSNEPSPEDLGLVQTRRGNVFKLSGSSGTGPSGTAKVFIK